MERVCVALVALLAVGMFAGVEAKAGTTSVSCCSTPATIEGGAAGSHLPERLVRLAPPATTMGPGCDPGRLANNLSDNCNNGVSSSCCEAVVTTVDTRGCFCAVANERTFVNDLAVSRVLQLYRECGGIRRLSDDSECEDVESTEQPTCPPSSPGPEKSGWSRMLSIDVAILVIVTIILAFVLSTVAWVIYHCSSVNQEMNGEREPMIGGGFRSAYANPSRATHQGYTRMPLAIDQSTIPRILAGRARENDQLNLPHMPELELVPVQEQSEGRRSCAF